MRKFWLLVLLIGANGFSQSDTIRGTSLREVVINAFHINDSLLKAPAAIGILTEADLQRNNSIDITPAINSIAGVFMQSGSLNTNRISIRGIGARTPFGTNKIRAFYGNIPLTSGDSETTIEDIDIENIEQAEIIKGPLSSVYGAGLGGAILLSPKTNEKPGHIVKIGAVHGSFGTLKNRVSYGYNSDKNTFNISYHDIHSDGWRQNSAYDRQGVTIAGELFRTDKSKLTYLGNYTTLKAFIPSSIDAEKFNNNPRAAAFTWNAAKGFEQYDSYLGGVSYDWQLSESFANTTSVFINFKDSNEPRPFDILRQDTKGYGARTQFTGKIYRLNLLFGAEYFHDEYSADTFENLYEENNDNGSLAGNRLTNSAQNRDFFNLFAQVRAPLVKNLELQAGLNVNQTRFALDTTFPTESESSEEYKYDAIVSPQLSLIYNLSKLQTIYASASRGFSTPAIEETLTADGTINPSIKPESGYNFEVGGKFYFLNRSLFTEVAFYHMEITDLLVAQRVDDDRYIGVNAGKTVHRGIELSANYSKRVGNWLAVNPFIALSVGDYSFKNFINNDIDYSGNELTGVPSKKLNGGIILQSDIGVYVSADFQYVDDFPINDANTIYNQAYRIWNLKSGYRFEILKGFESHISAGVNNVGNEKYASMVLVNATAFGSATPRYYYPGLPVNYYGSVSFHYNF